MRLRRKNRRLPRAHPTEAFRHEGETVLIEISVTKLGQLYNSFDPSPFLEKDLDDDADHYIFTAAREIGADKPFKLVIHVPPEVAKSADAEGIEQSIRGHYLYKLQTTRRDLRHELQRGRTSLLIGFVFLAACMSGREIALGFVPSVIQRIFSEGLLIIGWVAMFGPLEVFLYGWWPIAGTCRILERLAMLDVEVRPHAEASGLGAAPARG